MCAKAAFENDAAWRVGEKRVFRRLQKKNLPAKLENKFSFWLSVQVERSPGIVPKPDFCTHRLVFRALMCVGGSWTRLEGLGSREALGSLRRPSGMSEQSRRKQPGASRVSQFDAASALAARKDPPHLGVLPGAAGLLGSQPLPSALACILVGAAGPGRQTLTRPGRRSCRRRSRRTGPSRPTGP